MNNKGVSLVELLIVIVVMGIIAGIGTASVNQVLLTVRKNTFVANSELFIDVAQTAHAVGDSIFDDNIATLRELIDADYLEQMASDPWGGDYDLDASYIIVETVHLKDTVINP